VVATRVGGIGEQVRDSETGLLVDYRDSASMALKMRGLRESPSRSRDMAAAALKTVRERFSLDAMSAAYLEWYAAIAAESTNRHEKARTREKRWGRS
jgi:glycosyltransferase involved in cell wall biosynthesis